MKQDLLDIVWYSHGTGISWDTLLKKHIKRKCQYKRANKARTFSLARRFGDRSCPFICCFPICAENPGPTSDVFVEIWYAPCFILVWCLWQNTMHTECLLAIYGNLWQSLSCLSSRQLPLQLLTPEHSHSNPKNMNWRNIFLREKWQWFWGLGNWGLGKNRTLGFKTSFLGPLWAHLFIVSTVLLPWCQRSPSGWYSKRSCRTWCLHLFQAARHDARQAMETQ